MSKRHLTTKERNFRKLAAYIRLMETTIVDARSKLENFLTEDEKYSIARMLINMEMLRASAEDHLWDTVGYTEDGDPSNLFHGSLNETPIDRVDVDVIRLAKKIAVDLFAPKPDTRPVDEDGLPAIEWFTGIEYPEQYMKRPLTRFQSAAEEWARRNGGRGDD